MANLDDILTSMKLGVQALNSLSNTFLNTYSFNKGTTLARGPMSTAATTLYTVPTGAQVTVNDIEVCNTAGGAGTFTIYLVPSGASASAANALFSASAIAANTTYQWKGAQVITAGATIQALASATTITIMITGGVG